MASHLFPVLEKAVEDAWVRLDRDNITPWVFMTTGPPFQIKDFYGKTIAYQGIEFEGSPRIVFWGRYVEPFLEDIVDRVVNEALGLAQQKQQDAAIVLPEVAGLLKALARRAYARMTDIDCRLRGKGFPQNVLPRSTESEQLAMEAFINRRIAAELAMLKPKWRVNAFYNQHPFLFWFLALAAGVAATLLAE